MNKCPIPASIHVAIDGSLLSEQKIYKVYKRSLHEPMYPFKLNYGEIGCFLSYRAVWKRIIDENLDVALLIEDDIDINLAIFNQAFTLSIKYIMELGYVKFPIKHRKHKIRIVDTAKNVMLCEQEVIPSGTICQLVSSNAAKKMLDNTEYFDRPVDTFQQLRHITNQRIYSVYPNGITEISTQLSGSVIHYTRDTNNILTREWKRFKYRTAVSRLSARSFKVHI